MKEKEFDFNKEFDPDDRILDEITKIFGKSKTGTFEVNSESVRNVEIVCDIMKRIAKGKGVDVSYEMGETHPSMGSVTVLGKEVVIENPALFVAAAEMASNFEIYTKTDGTIQMNFGFNNLARRVGE